jgi:transcription elongation factor
MYKSAYAWSSDILPITVEAHALNGMKNEGGKAFAWDATFGSPSRMQFTKFTYSVVASPPEIRKGITAAEALPWKGPTPQALTFGSSDFAIDSDDAYKTAAPKAEAWLAKNPGKNLTEASMGAASRFPGPVWYFLWGDKKDGFFVLVSATTGKALK